MKILVEKEINAIKMPENLRTGILIAEQRKKCTKMKCNFDFSALSFGQSPFHVPEVIAKALGQNSDKSHYSDAQGIIELRKKVAEFNKKHFGLEINPSRIIIGPGTKTLIHMIFEIIKGDIIIPSPSWIGYYPEIKLLKKHFHTFYLKPEFDYKIQPKDLDGFLFKLHKDQRILVLNNPHNPTGNLYSKKELEEITKICRKHNVFVIADEIYALTSYNFRNFVSMGKIYPEGTFVTNGLSKDRSAGGYRLGHCILPKNCSK